MGDHTRAEEIEDEPVESYAARKRIEILDNPPVLESVTITRRVIPMAQAGPTKSELEETLDDLQDVLEDAYHPEATREELAEAIGKALDIIEGEDEEEGPGETDDEELEPGED